MEKYGTMTFSQEEYQRRLGLALKELEKAQLDLLVINSPDTITYLTGYQTSGYDSFTLLFLSSDGHCYMLTRLLEQINVTERTWLKDSFTYQDHEDPIQVVKKVFLQQSASAQRVGLEMDSFFLKHSHIQRLKDLWSDRHLEDATGLLNPIRVIKSDEEIAVLKRAARATEAGMVAGIAATRSGVSENDIAAEVHHAMFRAGGEYPCVPPYITSGPRSIISHSTWEGRKIENGDNVFIEVGGAFRRYHTAMMRTVYVGAQPPQAIIDAASMIQEELAQLMEAMKPGITAGEVDTLTRNPERLLKIGATRISRTGYGMGISYAPAWDEGHIVSLVQGNPTPLQENMVFHLIPWVQLPKLKTVVGISETVRVTQSGARSFFDLAQDLVIQSQ
jgi:Xaa-Pro dipeptidase